MAISNKVKTETLNSLYTKFFNSFQKVITEDLLETNYSWNRGFSITFFRDQKSSWSKLQTMSPNLVNAFEYFKTLITKEEIEVFVQDKSLNNFSDDRSHGSKIPRLQKEDISAIKRNLTIDNDSDARFVYFAKRSVYDIIIYTLKQDRKLLNFAFDKGCDKFVRYIIENHSQFLSQDNLLKKLDDATTDKTRRLILHNIYKGSGKDLVVSWVNKKGGLANMSKGLSDYIVYDLKIKSSEFCESSIDPKMESLSDILNKAKNHSLSLRKAFLKANSSISKSDKIYNNSLLSLFSEMSSFNELVSDIKALDNKEFSYLCQFLFHDLNSSKDLSLTDYNAKNLIESILYLPKSYSLFYIAEFDTINDFFTNIYCIQRADKNQKYNSFGLDRNSFGNLILNSSAKLF